MNNKFLNHFDYILLLCVLALTSMGIMFIYSSGINSQGVNVSNEYIKQIIWMGVGLIFMITFTLLDYRRFERYAPILYGVGIIVLIYTKLFGRYVNGARSWIGIGELGIQPSEIMKIIFIIFLSWYLNKSTNENPLKRFLISLAIMFVPFALILLQPDLGTASVYLPVFLLMCFIANLPLRYIMIVLCGGMVTIIFGVLPIWQTEIAHKSIAIINVLTNTKLLLLVITSSFLITIIGAIGHIMFKKKYFYWITYVFGIITFALIGGWAVRKVLKPYQIQRLIIFMNPNSDPRGAGWNIIQSKIAIGSGNFLGRGYLQGTQSHLRFLPQQSTDFIFSILAEETGFIGGIFVYSIFLLILLKIIVIIKNTTNTFGSYIASGILGMFFFHFLVNVGMVMGIMPITGIPLPFLSYGGSALLVNMSCIGIIMSINARRLDFTPNF